MEDDNINNNYFTLKDYFTILKETKMKNRSIKIDNVLNDTEIPLLEIPLLT